MKKRYLFLIIIICLFTVSAVSANEITNGTTVPSNDYDQNLVNESVEENSLSETYGTFEDLQNEINAVEEGGTLNLTKDYKNINGLTISINKKIIIDGKGHYLDGDFSSQMLSVDASNVILKNLKIINGSSPYGGAVIWFGNNGKFINCSFENNLGIGSSSTWGGAIYWSGKDGSIINCSFRNNSATCGGAIGWNGDNGKLLNCKFNECYVFTISKSNMNWGGAIYWNNKNGIIDNCTFINNYANDTSYGGVMYIRESNNISVNNCIFINNSADISRGYGGAINIGYSDYCSINNCIFINNTASSGNSIYCSISDYCISNKNFFIPVFNNLKGIETSNIIKRNSYLKLNNLSFCYQNPSALIVSLNFDNKDSINNKSIIINMNKGISYKTFNLLTNEFGICTLLNELNELDAGIWKVTVLFNGNDNYYSSKNYSTINILPLNSLLSINNTNTTVGHETTLIAKVISNSTVNEGIVTFFDGETKIGQANVYNGVATLTYTPSTVGNHTITAIFNSDNYLSSNSTATLLVDSTKVEILVDNGTVGYNSTFVANVKGRYSTINEGNVKFYIDDELIDIVPVINGSASTNYLPLIAGVHTVNAIYCDSDKFLDDEDSTTYTVSKADTESIINNLTTAVGYEITIMAAVTSPNNLSINEGTITLYDDETLIGESNVNDGIATLTYTPTRAGEHTITAIFNSDNYLSSSNTAALSVAKANIDLSIDDIAPVYFTNPSNFAVTINSNYKAVNEGTIKYYVNNKLIGRDNAYNGASNINYITDSAGFFILAAVYEETDNYLYSNVTTYFTVDKMPTTLSGETRFFDEDEYKTYTTELRDANNNGVANQVTTIEVVKYDGGSRTFTGVSDSNGVTTYDINNLAGGMWIVRGIYSENDNYIGSSFTNMFIVIRMNTTTTIEEIDKPRVNYTYKLKANIHDENGKLVKEGIVQFFLDGVDIGSIDLSKNNGHQSALKSGLLGASIDDEAYLEYTPTKAGNFKLSAVYEGTTVYKSSTSETDFIVKDSWKSTTELLTSDVETSYKGDGKLIVTLMDSDTNKAIESADLTVKLNNVVYTLKTDSSGQASLSVPSNLSPKSYVAAISYAGNENYDSSNTTANIVVNKASTLIYAPDVSLAYKYPNGELVATAISEHGKPLVVNLNINFNGKDYTVRTDSNGQASIPIDTLSPGTYTATVTYKGSANYKASTATTKVTVTKAATIISASDVSIAYKEPDGELVATITNEHAKPLVVNLNINFNGKDYTVRTDSEGKAIIEVGTLSPGKYSATVTYKGSSNYKASTTTAKVTVAKANTNITAQDVSLAYKDSTGELVASIISEHGKALVVTLNIELNGKTYNVKTDSNGQASIAIGTLTPGKYDATISYKGSSNYKASTTTAKITVTKAATSISASDISIAYKEPNGELVATVISEHEKPLVVTLSIDLNGKTYTVKTDSEGNARIAVGTLSSGKYTATITYKGSANYKASTTTAKITVTKATTSISSSDVSIAYKDPNGELVTTIISEHGKPLVVTLNVELNGKTYNVKTDSNGQAIIPIDTLTPGTYTATITYKGSSNYKASTTTAKVTVTKAATIISAPDVSVAQKDPNGALVSTITNEHGKPLVVNLNVNLNGKTYTAKTNSNGQASVSTADLAPGTYTATITYKGSANYKSTSTTANIQVKK